MLRELRDRITWWNNEDRIGPDVPTTHWKLYFRSTMLSLCRKKFLYFDATADFRPGAYAIGCSKISIGGRVVIRQASMLFADEFAGILIEEDVLLGPGIHIYVNNHKFDDPAIPIREQGYYPSEDVVLKKGCWVGANSIILPGVTVGRNSVVAAGAIVTKTVPENTLVGGNPARIIRQIASDRA